MKVTIKSSVLLFYITSVTGVTHAAESVQVTTVESPTVEQQQSQPAIKAKMKAITVTAQDPFDKAGASSQRGADDFGRDINSVLRDMPGSFTQHDIGQGGISVNLRGLDGMGRVNTTVDGVSQTFYQSTPHGWNGNTTYVDENFIAGIDIEKGSIAGSNGANALVGSANFRTINANDIIKKDAKYGARFVFRAGDNGYGENGMLATAIRHELNKDAKISAIMAFSAKNKYGYKNGAGEAIAGDNFSDGLAQEAGSKARSILSKIEFSPNAYNHFILSYIANSSDISNNHTPLEIDTKTNVFEYKYSPLSDWINLKLSGSYNVAEQKYVGRDNANEENIGRKSKNPAIQFDLENTSSFELGQGDLDLNYGLKLMNNKNKAINSKSSDVENYSGMFDGRQNIQSYFISTTLDIGGVTLQSGLRQEYYNVEGYVPKYDGETDIIAFGSGKNFDNKESHLNPNLTLAYRLTDWFQIYGSYAFTSRSPNLNEVMYANNSKQPLSINPYLKGEEAENRDIGFNIVKSGIFNDEDVLRAKLNYFNNNIDNYIVEDQFYICNGDTVFQCSLDEADQAVGIYHNVNGNTKMEGYEFEMSYQASRGYVNLNYSRIKNNFPADYLADMGFSHLSTLPSSYWGLELGGFWFDQHLLAGLKLSYTGKDTVADGVDVDLDKQATKKNAASPILVNLFIKYQLNRSTQLFFDVENLANKVYNYPVSGGTIGTGNTGDSWANQGTGRGRTISSGITFNF